MNDDTPMHEAAAALALERIEGRPGADATAQDFAARSDLHRRAFQEARHALDRLDALKNDDAFAGLRAEALRARPRARRLAVPWLAAAGVGALTLLAALLHALQEGTPGGSLPTVAAAGELYRTGLGERRTLALPDGSQAVLDASSALRVRYGPFDRSLDLLSGQALFRVAKHQLRPFRVYAGDERVTATGTVFDVRNDPGHVKVSLIEGRVRVETRASTSTLAAQTILLTPGQAVDRRANELRVSEVDPVRARSWSSGVLDFDGETLADAAAEMNRYSAHPLRIDGAQAQALAVGGAFTPGDTERFARTMTEIFPLEMRQQADGTIVLSARPS